MEAGCFELSLSGPTAATAAAGAIALVLWISLVAFLVTEPPHGAHVPARLRWTREHCATRAAEYAAEFDEEVPLSIQCDLAVATHYAYSARPNDGLDLLDLMWRKCRAGAPDAGGLVAAARAAVRRGDMDLPEAVGSLFGAGDLEYYGA